MIENDTIALLEKIKKKLEHMDATISTAESCTGGIVATLLTHLPGSSKTYVGGINAYANHIKTNLLDVNPDLIRVHGAVSGDVAKAMALGVRAKMCSTYSISITGIAGPDGGTAAKPVGTVYCGIASPSGVTSTLFHLHGDRNTIRQKAAFSALNLLYQNL